MNRNRAEKRHAAPLVRVRFMIAAVGAVTVIIAVPLLLVWKQAYIASAAVRIEALTDTVSTLNRTIAKLQLLRDRLSSNERIEKIARGRLGLDYPSSDRIVIVPVNGTSQKHGLAAGVGDLMALVQGQGRTSKGGTE